MSSKLSKSYDLRGISGMSTGLSIMTKFVLAIIGNHLKVVHIICFFFFKTMGKHNIRLVTLLDQTKSK